MDGTFADAKDAGDISDLVARLGGLGGGGDVRVPVPSLEIFSPFVSVRQTPSSHSIGSSR